MSRQSLGKKTLSPQSRVTLSAYLATAKSSPLSTSVIIAKGPITSDLSVTSNSSKTRCNERARTNKWPPSKTFFENILGSFVFCTKENKFCSRSIFMLLQFNLFHSPTTKLAQKQIVVGLILAHVEQRANITYSC